MSQPTQPPDAINGFDAAHHTATTAATVPQGSNIVTTPVHNGNPAPTLPSPLTHPTLRVTTHLKALLAPPYPRATLSRVRATATTLSPRLGALRSSTWSHALSMIQASIFRRSERTSSIIPRPRPGFSVMILRRLGTFAARLNRSWSMMDAHGSR
jgi:hypothetical protein